MSMADHIIRLEDDGTLDRVFSCVLCNAQIRYTGELVPGVDDKDEVLTDHLAEPENCPPLESGEFQISDVGIDVPEWISQDITYQHIRTIMQGGCASGAYMPAVTYYQALKTMSEHGDAVFDYLDDGDCLAMALESLSCHTQSPSGLTPIQSWAGMACYFLSSAVEQWAHTVEQQVTDGVRG